MSTDSTEEETAGAETEKPLLQRKITRRDAIKYSIIGGVCLAGIGSIIHFLLKEAKKGSLTQVFKGQAPNKLWKWSREAYHYIKLGRNVQCQICPNECILEPDDRSVCRVKVNKNSKLYTVAYGNPCSVNIDPIEKKPLFHFLPRTVVFSIATAGCNLRCLNCQNWQISQNFPEDTINYDLFPEKVVEFAQIKNCKSIAYTYSEPTAFYEYMYDTAKLAREKGLKNVWVTNGYIKEKPLRDLAQYLDAANVDLKSFKESIYNELNSGHLQPILDTLITLKEMGVWFEITTLIVPTYVDDMQMIEKMCRWILKNLGPDYPLHFSRFRPEHKLRHLPPTPITTLEQARKIALDTGIHYVYIGNVPLHPGENTYCPECKKLIIERKGYYVVQKNLEDNRCEFCKYPIAGVWSDEEAISQKIPASAS